MTPILDKPAAMRRAIGSILVGVLALGACGAGDEELAANRAAAIEVVEAFGERIVHVSKLAPPDSVTDQIRDQYGPYVTTLLLGGWLSDPASAPGRETSSPWPAGLEVREATPVGGTAVDVVGEVLFLNQVDAAPVLRKPVRLRVVRGQDGAWRISEWTTGP